jgi:hypothetical protein
MFGGNITIPWSWCHRVFPVVMQRESPKVKDYQSALPINEGLRGDIMRQFVTKHLLSREPRGKRFVRHPKYDTILRNQNLPG